MKWRKCHKRENKFVMIHRRIEKKELILEMNSGSLQAEGFIERLMRFRLPLQAWLRQADEQIDDSKMCFFLVLHFKGKLNRGKNKKLRS